MRAIKTQVIFRNNRTHYRENVNSQVYLQIIMGEKKPITHALKCSIVVSSLRDIISLAFVSLARGQRSARKEGGDF